MDIKDLNKKQLILLTLLITFVVSIATGIVTVTLMNKMPAKTTQTINNIVQRTIEKVVLPTEDQTTQTLENNKSESKIYDVGDALVRIYPIAEVPTDKTETNPVAGSTNTTPVNSGPTPKEPVKSIGQGIIISEEGLILIESNILSKEKNYAVMLGKEFFKIKVVKIFSNGFSILSITSKIDPIIVADESKKENPTPPVNPAEPTVDKPQQ